MVFRRKWGTPIWHWSARCGQWPSAVECEERPKRPVRGELCNECQAKEPIPETEL